MFHSKSGVSDFDTSASAAWLKCVLKQRSGKSHTYIKNNKLYFFKIRLCFDACRAFLLHGATIGQRWVSYEQHRIILLM